jgi:acylphosphatase
MGFVRNLPDGRVHLVIEGFEENIDRFLVELRKEMGRYITDQQEISRPASGRFSEFEVR